MKSQIQQTIEEHFSKEKKLKDKGIKVLSLFFIDQVKSYRHYDENGNPQKEKRLNGLKSFTMKSVTNPCIMM